MIPLNESKLPTDCNRRNPYASRHCLPPASDTGIVLEGCIFRTNSQEALWLLLWTVC